MQYQLINKNISSNKIQDVIFTNRGFNVEDIQHYLTVTDEDIYSPLLLDNIQEGAKILLKHIKNKSKIMVQVDSDCDGYTSAALLLNYLHRLFPNYVDNNVIFRLHDSKVHGIILDTIPDDVQLLIVPDAGSSNFEQHKILKDKGIDVLVIDHHEAKYISPDACIINNQLDKYPNKTLSGVGVTFKFCNYLDSLFGTSYSERYYDLVALGVVADMVSLQDFETRRLISIGLHQKKNPFIVGMVEKNSYSLGKELTPIGIAFYIAPFINAVTRVGTIKEKETLFRALLEFQAYDTVQSTKRGAVEGEVEILVQQAIRICTNVKNRQTKIRDERLERVERIIKEQSLLDNKILIIKNEDSDEDFRKVTGLVANEIMHKYKMPTLVVHKSVKEDGVICWNGSGRGYDRCELTNLRGFLENTGLVNYAEGHALAFGISIDDDKIQELTNYVNEKLVNMDFSPAYNVDFIFNAISVNPNDIADIGALSGYWGQGIEESFIVIEDVPINANNIHIMGSRLDTLKISLPQGIELIKFNSSEEEYEELLPDNGFTTNHIDIVGNCNLNEWNGKITPQVKIVDYNRSVTSYEF